jgi:hypothetical protein
MEGLMVPTDILVDGYFMTVMVTQLTSHVTTAQGGVEMNLSNFCPIPLAWAPYFLHFKPPYKALEILRVVVASLDDVTHPTQVLAPLLDCGCRAACTQLGVNTMDRTTRPRLEAYCSPCSSHQVDEVKTDPMIPEGWQAHDCCITNGGPFLRTGALRWSYIHCILIKGVNHARNFEDPGGLLLATV